MATPLLVQTEREEIVEYLSRVHGTQLVKYLSRVLGQAAAAEDVAQDTYERLLRWDQLEDMPSEGRKAVLFKAAHRLAIDRVRRAQTAALGELKLAPERANEAFESLAQPEKQAMSRQAITHLTQIVDSLPDRLREPWILRYIEELPGHAICARLGIPETTLEQRLREARAFCRAQMARDGFDWSWLD